MRGIQAIKGLTALICSLLMVFQPVLGAPTPSPTGADANLIAVAKLTGTADRNGQPLLNGSIVSSGDSLSIHGNSALLLASSPQERIWLGPNTTAKITKDVGNVAIALKQGTIGFQTRGHIQVTFENHDGLAVRSRPDSPALAQLSFLNDQEAQVRLQEGSLELVEGGRTVLLQPEKSSSISTSGSHLLNEAPAKKNSGAQAEAASQSDTGSVTGTVVNAGLFAVPGANVTLTSTAGKTLTAVTGQEGKFAFNDVPPGSYTLHVTRQGYKSYDLPNVVVRAGNESNLYVQLGGGAAKQGGGPSNLMLWVILGGAAAGGIGAYLATKGSSSPSPSSPSTTP